MTYERIRFDGKTVILRNATETKMGDTRVLVGVEVDSEGQEVAPRGVDERQHIIELDLVTRRTPMVMNNHYGMLEVQR